MHNGRPYFARARPGMRWPRPSNQPTVGLPSLLLSHPQRLPPLPSAPQSRPAFPPHGLRTRHKRQFNNPQVWQLWVRASRARCQLPPRTCHHRQPLPLPPPAPSLPAPPIHPSTNAATPTRAPLSSFHPARSLPLGAHPALRPRPPPLPWLAWVASPHHHAPSGREVDGA